MDLPFFVDVKLYFTQLEDIPFWIIVVSFLTYHFDINMSSKATILMDNIL